MAATKRNTSKPASRGAKSTTGRSTAKSKTAPRASGTRKTSAKKTPQTSEYQSRAGRTLLLLVLMIVLIVFQIEGRGSERLSGVSAFGAGILGSTAVWIPAVFLALLAFSSYIANRREDGSARWILIPVISVLLLLTDIEAFFVEEIRETGTLGYVDFLVKAYRQQTGGGLFGALLAYPLESVLGPGFTTVLLIAAEGLILHFSGVIDGNAIASLIGKGASAAGRGVADAAVATAGKVRTAVREHKAERETLYEETIDDSDMDGEDVEIPKLDGKKKRMEPVSPVGDEFEVPVAGRKKKKASAPDPDHVLDFLDPPVKPAGTKSPAAKPAPSKLTEDISREDPQKRNTRYIDHVPGNSDEVLYGPKVPSDPKRDAYYSRQKSGSSAAAKTPAKTDVRDDKDVEDFVRQVNEAAAPAHKKPQQPKPSFFEEDKPDEAGKTVRQNSDQGKPSETTYVKPDLGGHTSAPAGSGASPAAPAAPKAAAPKPAAPAPKPEYVFPDMDLMETGGPASTNVHSVDEIDKQRALHLVETLSHFNIDVKLTGITHGPAVTRYEILPAPGIKVAKIAGLSDDIAMAMEAVSVRIEAPIPGKNAVGIELPNPKTEVVHLRDILESPDARRNTKKLMVAMGKDNNGRYIVADLGSMPHVLIAGQTGSGKSVCINAFIISLLYRATPEEVRMIMIDPKMVELNVYNTIPHLLVPVVTDPKKAAGALDWAVAEMTRRYKVMAEKGAKNIESYNNHLLEGEEPLPQIVIIVDELADLMMSSPREVEDAICRLAQLARAAGMHLVIATQRPSVDVITGLIKANIPTRIAFTVASGVDSKTILDTVGAEKLLGRGDMLYKPQDKNKPIRMQGAWVSEDEVDRVVEMVSSSGQAEFSEEMLEHMENAAMSDAEKKDKHEEKVTHEVDDLFERAVRECVAEGQASTSMLQRRLRVGYARAGSLIDEMEQRGYISGSNGSKSRNVLVTAAELDQIFGPRDDEE